MAVARTLATLVQGGRHSAGGCQEREPWRPSLADSTARGALPRRATVADRRRPRKHPAYSGGRRPPGRVPARRGRRRCRLCR
eukprot:6174873-Prymnesium_polylepis.1